ncbi:hypothetical protein KR009_010224, partial [Drosophila setifemur]
MHRRKLKRNARYWRQRAAPLQESVSKEQNHLQHHESILWSPQLQEQDEKDVLDYLDFASRQYDNEEEQALFILRRYGFDLGVARQRLTRFETTRGCRRWKAQNLVLLSKAFDQHGTDFAQVRKK